MMPVNLYGNISDKRYQPHMPAILETADRQKQQALTLKESGILADAPAVKLNISKDGLRALHGDKLSGSRDISEVTRQIAFMEEHQPVRSFTSRFSQAMRSAYDRAEGGDESARISLQKKADALLSGYKEIYHEVTAGYENGTRVRYVEDVSSADGFRRLTKEEELDILKKEFDDFVDFRFGAERQKQSEAVTKAVNEFQRIKQMTGKGAVRAYQPEVIPDGFAQRIKEQADGES